MKGGSSWIWRQLKSHPEISMPKRKELHFIDRLGMTLEKYLNKFDKKGKVGEYTPNYICCPYAPSFVKSHFPTTKLFSVFRNPVDRAFSHYKDHLFYKKIPNATFIDAFRHGKGDYSIKSKGLYADQLEAWQKHDLKVMFYDDLVSDPIGFLNELFRWIGVSEFVPPEYEKKVIKSYNRAYDGMKMIESDRAEVLEYYKDQIEKFENMTKRKLNWH